MNLALKLACLAPFAALAHNVGTFVLVGDYHWRAALELDGSGAQIVAAATGRYDTDAPGFSTNCETVVFSPLPGMPAGVYLLDWYETNNVASVSRADFDAMEDLARWRAAQGAGEWPSVKVGKAIAAGWLGPPEAGQTEWNTWWRNELTTRLVDVSDISDEIEDSGLVASSRGVKAALEGFYSPSKRTPKPGLTCDGVYDYSFQDGYGMAAHSPALTPGASFHVTLDCSGYMDYWDSYPATAYLQWEFYGYLYDDETGDSHQVYSYSRYPEGDGYLYFYDDVTWEYVTAEYDYGDSVWRWQQGGTEHTGHTDPEFQCAAYGYFYDRNGNNVSCYCDYYDEWSGQWQFSYWNEETQQGDYFLADEGRYSVEVWVPYLVSFEETYILAPSFSGTGVATVAVKVPYWANGPAYFNFEVDRGAIGDTVDIGSVNMPSPGQTLVARFWFANGDVWAVDSLVKED